MNSSPTAWSLKQVIIDNYITQVTATGEVQVTKAQITYRQNINLGKGVPKTIPFTLIPITLHGL
jgi:hypothetical protein